MCALVTLVTVPVSLRFASWIRRPLQELGQEMGKIERLDIDADRPVTSRIVEVNRMARELDNMKNSLRSFRKYVPARLVTRLLELGVEAELGGAKEQVSIFFSDIAGFTTVSEKLTPEKLVEFLGEYLNVVTDTLMKHDATVDKYIGDAVMAFWNAPVRQADHALLACRAALECRRNIDLLNERWAREGRGVEFRTRIGIHTGDVIVGNMGSAQRLAYTIMGDNVNLASRVEGANKAYGTDALITGATYEQVKLEVVARRIDRVAVKGKSIPVDFFELLGLRSEASSAVLENATECDRGFELFLERQFERAARVFQEILQRSPGDVPAGILYERCIACQAAPPPEDWDGSRALTEK
jgi:adenylate cyclase